MRAIYTAFWQQWKTSATNSTILLLMVRATLMVSVIAWIAGQSNDPSVLTYILVGAPLMSIWEGVLHRVGWSLSSELFSRTLEFTLVSRTQLIFVMFGKSLAQVLYGIPFGIVSFVTIFVITGILPEVSSIGLLIPSFLLVIMSMTITSLLIAPLLVIVGGRGGFFDALIPFGVVLSGFLFPIDRLPVALEIAARCLPSSWAMECVWYAIEGYDSLWTVFGSLGMYILSLLAITIITYTLFKLVEKRIRITGGLIIY